MSSLLFVISRLQITSAVVAIALLLLCPNAYALSVHYGNDRHEALAECDRFAYVGENAQATNCLESLSDHEELLVQADAAAALGDVRLANKLYRQATSDSADPLVKTHWATLYLKTHQVSDAISLFREALLFDEGFLPARLGMVEATMQTYEGQAREELNNICLLYTSPSPRDKRQSRMPSSA